MLAVIDVYTNMIQQPCHNLQTTNGAPKGPIFHFIKFTLLKSLPALEIIELMIPI
jgi:hypothetical protein